MFFYPPMIGISILAIVKPLDDSIAVLPTCTICLYSIKILQAHETVTKCSLNLQFMSLPYVSDFTVIHVVAVFREHRRSHRRCSIKAMATTATRTETPIRRQCRGGTATSRDIKDTTNLCLSSCCLPACSLLQSFKLGWK